ncbi:MAG: hypothetical protein JEY79_14145 [Pseudodesulfovibrio sp.]|nr:hypothetical protein [Pseudodesulfovibrio sp.]
MSKALAKLIGEAPAQILKKHGLAVVPEHLVEQLVRVSGGDDQKVKAVQFIIDTRIEIEASGKISFRPSAKQNFDDGCYGNL